MEKWARSLSKPIALIIGIIGLLITAMICIVAYNMISGIIGMIVVGGLLGGGIGFSATLLIKGITGYTPQEKKEMQEKTK